MHSFSFTSPWRIIFSSPCTPVEPRAKESINWSEKIIESFPVTQALALSWPWMLASLDRKINWVNWLLDRVRVKVWVCLQLTWWLLASYIKTTNSHLLHDGIFFSDLKLGQSQSAGKCCHLYSAFFLILWDVLCLIKYALEDTEERDFNLVFFSQ